MAHSTCGAIAEGQQCMNTTPLVVAGAVRRTVVIAHLHRFDGDAFPNAP
jgi:hypothetical protein